LAGRPHPFLPNPPVPTSLGQENPAASANGAWVFFTAIDTRSSCAQTCLLRAPADSSSAEVVVSPSDPRLAPFDLAPAPNGSKVVYATQSGLVFSTSLRKPALP
jgi:hypothetical protein